VLWDQRDSKNWTWGTWGGIPGKENMFNDSKITILEKDIKSVVQQINLLASSICQINSHLMTVGDSLQDIRNQINELKQQVNSIQEHKCQCGKHKINEHVDEVVDEKRHGKFDKVRTDA